MLVINCEFVNYSDTAWEYQVIEWINVFLKDRRQCVVLEGTSS